MRPVRALVGVLVAMVAMAVVPASAAASGLGWYDAAASAPVSVNFADVSAIRVDGKDVVVAVGTDSRAADVTDDQVAVVYRYVNGTWKRQEITGLPPDATATTPATPTSLSKVAMTDQAVWAVGTKGAPAPASPALVVRFNGTPQELATGGGKWEVVNPQASIANAPRSIALGRTAAGSDGYLGDSGGNVYPVHDHPGPPPDVGIDSPLSNKNPAPKSVEGLALVDKTAVGAFAVGQDGPAASADTSGSIGAPAGSPPPSGLHIYQTADGRSVSPANAAPTPPGAGDTDLVGVDALSSVVAVAIEGGSTPATWEPDGNGLWTRKSDSTGAFSSSTLRDVDLTTGVQVIAGQFGTGDRAPGAVWTRATGTVPWTRDTSLTTPLNGVAALARDDIWVVGNGGALKHYYDQPPVVEIKKGPDPTDGTGGHDTGTGDNGTPPASTGGGREQHAASSAPLPSVEVDQRPAPGDRPARREPGNAGNQPPPAERLLTGVKVTLRKHALVVSFVLAAPAKVAARATTGKRVVARTPLRTLAAGEQKLVVPFHGRRPPTHLKLVVRPAEGSAQGSS
jgi:hypothetical protein